MSCIVFGRRKKVGCINLYTSLKKFVVNELNRHNAQVYSNQFCLSSQEEMRFLFLKREVTSELGPLVLPSEVALTHQGQASGLLRRVLRAPKPVDPIQTRQFPHLLRPALSTLHRGDHTGAAHSHQPPLFAS